MCDDGARFLPESEFPQLTIVPKNARHANKDLKPAILAPASGVALSNSLIQEG